MTYEYRTLIERDFRAIVKTMQDGFADYFVKIDLNETGCRNKFALEGVKYSASAGAFEKGSLVGVTMNGVGVRNGDRTVYDAGTVVLPAHRARGVSTGMFEYLLPRLADKGFKSYLLEVICENVAAIRLYQKLGFVKNRKLGVFVKKNPGPDALFGSDLEIKRIGLSDLDGDSILDGEGLAWQNSNALLRNAEAMGYDLKMYGVFVNSSLLGFGAVGPKTGRVMRIAVKPSFRRQGVGSVMLAKLESVSQKPLIFVNVDLADEATVAFMESKGCEKTIEQYEMERLF